MTRSEYSEFEKLFNSTRIFKVKNNERHILPTGIFSTSFLDLLSCYSLYMYYHKPHVASAVISAY